LILQWGELRQGAREVTAALARGAQEHELRYPPRRREARSEELGNRARGTAARGAHVPRRGGVEARPRGRGMLATDRRRRVPEPQRDGAHDGGTGEHEHGVGRLTHPEDRDGTTGDRRRVEASACESAESHWSAPLDAPSAQPGAEAAPENLFKDHLQRWLTTSTVLLGIQSPTRPLSAWAATES